jgi:hypothetical protein
MDQAHLNILGWEFHRAAGAVRRKRHCRWRTHPGRAVRRGRHAPLGLVRHAHGPAALRAGPTVARVEDGRAEEQGRRAGE